MKFVIPQTAFEIALKRARLVAAKVSAAPITAHVLIQAEGDQQGNGRVVCTGTNFDTQIESSQIARVEIPGKICLPAETVLKFVAALPAGSDISVAPEKEGRVRLRCGKSSAVLAALKADDFPIFKPGWTLGQDKTTQAAFNLPSGELRRLFGRALDGPRKDATREYLAGIHMVLRNGRLIVEGCDTTVLFRASTSAPVQEMPEIVVPLAPINALMSLLPDTSDPAEVTVDKSFLAVSAPGAALTTKLIDAKYSEQIENFIPKLFGTVITTSGRDLRNAVTRLLGLADNLPRELTMEAVGGALRIETSAMVDKMAAIAHEGSDEIAAEIVGDVRTFKVNGRKLLQGLAEAGDKLTLQFGTGDLALALVIRDEDPDWFFLVFGLR